MNTEIFDLGKIGITLGYEYDNKAIYEKLTIVLYKGKSYISTKTTKGVSPEQDNKIWQLIAEAKDAYHMLVDAGKITLTEKEFLEQLVDATKGRYIIQGNVINAADEEDLTVEHSSLLGIDTLKLADRPSTNGMGYIILRKNKTFAEQVTKENTIYEIRYNFDLNNQENIIPNNCVLKFEGGKLLNGTIKGNNTIINSIYNNIFNENIVIKGTWNIKTAYYDWFEIKKDGTVDNTETFKSCILLSTIVVLSKDSILKLTSNNNGICINITNTVIIGNNSTLNVIGSEGQVNTFFIAEAVNNGYFELHDVTINGIGEYLVNPGDATWMYKEPNENYKTSNVFGLRAIGKSTIKLYNVTFNNCLFGYRQDQNQSDIYKTNVIINGCKSDDKCILPVHVNHVNNLIITNCEFLCSDKTNNLIHHLYLSTIIDNLYINNCVLKGGVGDPLDLYNINANTYIENTTIIAGNYSAMAITVSNNTIHVDNCNFTANSRGVIYIDRVSNIEVNSSNLVGLNENVILSFPYQGTSFRNNVCLKSCTLKANRLHTDAYGLFTLTINGCNAEFTSSSNIIRPVQEIESICNIYNTYIWLPNFTRYSVAFDLQYNNYKIKAINVIFDRATKGDWLIYLTEQYNKSIFINNCTCYNVTKISALEEANINTEGSIKISTF